MRLVSGPSGLTWRDFAGRVWIATQQDDIFGLAAQLSYYFLLAVFPFFLFLTTLLGLLAKTGTEIYGNLLSNAALLLPDSAFQLVVTTLAEIQKGAGGAKLGFGIVAALWASSSGMLAMIEGLNRAYEVKVSRPWWRERLISIGFTIFLSGFLIVSIVLVLYGSRIAEAIARYFGLSEIFTFFWNLFQWPVALLFVLLALGLLYRYAPNTSRGRWHEMVPGAFAGMMLWLVVSLLFRLYLQFFNSYNKTYGSLGAVIVLMLWLNLSSAAILVGAEVNAVLSKASTASRK